MKTKKQMQAEIDRLTKQNADLVEALIAAAKRPAEIRPPVFVPQPYPVYPPTVPYWQIPRDTPDWWQPSIIWCGNTTGNSIRLDDSGSVLMMAPTIEG